VLARGGERRRRLGRRGIYSRRSWLERAVMRELSPLLEWIRTHEQIRIHELSPLLEWIRTHEQI
jgi:hypothetical protein